MEDSNLQRVFLSTQMQAAHQHRQNSIVWSRLLGIANGGGFQEGGSQIVECAAFASRGHLLLQGNSYLKSTLRLLLRRRV